MNAIKPLLLAASLMLSSAVWAEGGSDLANQRIKQLRDKAQVALVKAEKAPPEQRHAQMAEHMQMLGEMLKQLRADHPAGAMTAEQHLAWMEEHDKLIGDSLTQMQREHSLMLSK